MHHKPDRPVNNSVNSSLNAKGNHSRLFSAINELENLKQRSNLQENYLKCVPSHKDGNLEKIKSLQPENPKILNSSSDDMVKAKLLNFTKSCEIGSKITPVSDCQEIPKNHSGLQLKYAPRFFPKKLKENSSLKDTSQDRLDPGTKLQEKYVPQFTPKLQKQNLQLFTEIYPKVTPTIHSSKLSVNKERILKTNEHDKTGIIINQSPSLKVTSDKFENFDVWRKIKTQRTDSKTGFKREVENSPAAAKRKTNGRKRVNEELNSPKKSKTKSSVINKKAKQSTPKLM